MIQRKSYGLYAFRTCAQRKVLALRGEGSKTIACDGAFGKQRQEI